VYSVASVLGAVVAGILAWAIQSGGANPARIRAMLLVLCGAVLPVVALVTHITEWTVVIFLAAMCSMAYAGWSTLLHTAVADTAPVWCVAVAVAIAAAAGNLGSSLSSQLFLGSGFGTFSGTAAGLAILALLFVGLMAWLRTDPAV
jgi:hypothetical protein